MPLKKQKLNNGQCVKYQGDDRISKLTDPLLHHILSFLPTKCVVCTSILSKRWRYMWISVPILDFRKWRSPATVDIHLETEQFRNFMDRMFLLRGTLNIQKFCLVVDKHFDESQVNAWIMEVVRRKVEELILIFNLEYPVNQFLFTPSLFTCESLVSLELEMDSELILPKSIYFPRLKILQLAYITFTDENLSEKLFSNCPVLEELNISCCPWIIMNNLYISAPKLKRLFIHAPEVGININAPNVESLRYGGRVANEYVVHPFSSLVDAEVDFYMDVEDEDDIETRKEEIGYAAPKLLEGLSSVRILTVSGHTFEALSLAGDVLTNLPAFDNLIYLEVSSELRGSTDRALLNLIKISPKLDTLVFAAGLTNDDDGWALSMVPQCLFLHLKSVKFKSFKGHKRELNMVKLFLKNAIALEQMTIVTSPVKKKMKKKMKVMEQLLMLPRTSSSCVIKFA